MENGRSTGSDFKTLQTRRSNRESASESERRPSQSRSEYEYGYSYESDCSESESVTNREDADDFVCASELGVRKKELDAARMTLWASTCLLSSHARVTSVKSLSFLNERNVLVTFSWKSFHFKLNFSVVVIAWLMYFYWNQIIPPAHYPSGHVVDTEVIRV